MIGMSDYISRSALLEKSYAIDEYDLESGDYVYVVDEADIKSAPAVEVRPVVHARWIFVNEKCGCSECRKCLSYDGNGIILDLSHLPYCPHCGAIMDLEEEGTDE